MIEDHSYVFKWWDKNGNSQSFNSGLDDYPRNDKYNSEYKPIGHIDSQSWMYFFASTMQKLFNNLQ